MKLNDLNEKVHTIGNDEKRDKVLEPFRKAGKVKTLTYNAEAMAKIATRKYTDKHGKKKSYNVYPTKDKLQMDIIIDSLDEIKDLMKEYNLSEIDPVKKN